MAEATQIPSLERSTGSKTIADLISLAARKHGSSPGPPWLVPRERTSVRLSRLEAERRPGNVSR